MPELANHPEPKIGTPSNLSLQWQCTPPYCIFAYAAILDLCLTLRGSLSLFLMPQKSSRLVYLLHQFKTVHMVSVIARVCGALVKTLTPHEIYIYIYIYHYHPLQRNDSRRIRKNVTPKIYCPSCICSIALKGMRLGHKSDFPFLQHSYNMLYEKIDRKPSMRLGFTFQLTISLHGSCVDSAIL